MLGSLSWPVFGLLVIEFTLLLRRVEHPPFSISGLDKCLIVPRFSLNFVC